MTLLEELLARAQSKLKEAENALQRDPTNKWLRMAVEHEQDQVASIRQGLQGAGQDAGPRGASG